MRVGKPGKVRDHLWLLGHEESGVYLLEGRDESMVISGGMGYIVPAIIRQFKEFGLERERIKKILILHSHFDHVGVVPFFKRSHPDLHIYASERAWEILQMPKAIKTINEFSLRVTERMGMLEACSAYDLDWRDDISGTAISEGESIDLGDMDIQIIETPGHSSCSISAYVTQLKALFPSDGGGIPYKETIIPSGNSNYTKMQKSLEKLKGLEVEYVCADHYGYVTGEEARRFIPRSIELARDSRTEMEALYRRTGDVETGVKELADSFYSENPEYFLSREIYEGVYHQVLRHLVEAMEGKV